MFTDNPVYGSLDCRCVCHEVTPNSCSPKTRGHTFEW